MGENTQNLNSTSMSINKISAAIEILKECLPICIPFPEPPKKVVMVPWDSTHDFPKLPVIWIRGKDDYREHLVIGYANPVAVITATCGSCPVLESMHLNSDWRHGSIEWSTDRKTWQPCEKPAGS